MDNWGKEEIDAIYAVIESNKLTMGEEVKNFESEVSKKFGSRFAIMVNSGSSANFLMLAATKIFLGKAFGPESNIIVPSVSWSTTYTPSYFLGIKLKFVDIEISNFGLNIDYVEQAIDKNTIAILTVNLLGSPSDLNRLNEIAKKNNILLLEDNCESLGAELEGKFTGSFGLMGTHSSFFSHHLNTIEGGWITTDNEELLEILLSLRAHGWTRELSPNSRFRDKDTSDWFQSKFEFVLPGLNFRPLEIEAAIGNVQLRKFDAMIEQRRKNALVFSKLIEKLPSVKIQKPLGNSTWFAFAMVFENNKIRRLVAETFKKNGIECRPIVAGNFTHQPVMKYLDYEISSKLDNSDLLDSCGLYIGNHPLPLEEKIYETVNILESVLI